MIYLVGVDYKHASVAQREQFSFTSTQQEQLLKRLYQLDCVSGCVLLCTCNRTELYVSAKESFDVLTCFLSLLDIPRMDQNQALFYQVSDKEAMHHLMQVACGLQSQILGEDQITTQVKQALAFAQKHQMTDAVLSTFFRCAITAGKMAKEKARLVSVPRSAAHRSVRYATQIVGSLQGKQVLVIGNGEMGRLAARLFVEQGAEVTVTLRTYHRGVTVVPQGCHAYPYDQRWEQIAKSEIVVSATTSPHYTITARQMDLILQKPKLLIDLAMPRDIDPMIQGVACVNIDDLGDLEDENVLDVARIESIMAEQIEQFEQWQNYRSSLPAMDKLKQVLCHRMEWSESNKEMVSRIVDKTVDLMMGAMKTHISADFLAKMIEKLDK